MATAKHEDESDDQQEGEYTLPIGYASHQTSYYRGANRCNAIDGTKNSHEVGKFLAAIHVGTHALGDDDAASSSQSLENSHQIEEVDVRGDDAEYGGDGEHQHGANEYFFPAKLIRQWSDEHLSYRQANHTSGKTKRSQGW